MSTRIFYSGWERPPKKGLLGLGMAGTIMLLISVIITIALMANNILVAIGFGCISAVITWGAVAKDRYHSSLLEKIGEKIMFSLAKTQKQNIYRSGPTSRLPKRTHQLPGLLARSELSEHVDPLDRPFAVISYKSAPAQNTVVLKAVPDGADLVDQHTINNFVARFGDWLNQLNQDSSLLGASIVIETAPDFGSRLKNEISDRLDETAPDFALATMKEISETFPVGGSELRVFITLSFNTTFAGKKKSLKAAVEEISLKLPEITRTLEAAGASNVTPLDAAALCEVVRAAYDPASAELLERTRAAGQPSGLTWAEAGPVTAISDWEWYRHDSGFSKTWQMAIAPRSAVTERTLGRLLAPTPDITRKRISILYRPISPALAAAMADSDIEKSESSAGNIKGRVTARNKTSIVNAQLRAAAEAAGAGLMDFGLMVTATITDPDRKDEIDTLVHDLSGAAHLALRPVYGAQAAGFATALPLGIMPERLRLLTLEMGK